MGSEKYSTKDIFDVRGKVALITGGSSGIGKMIATAFVEHGAKVYISSRNAAVCDKISKDLSAEGECIALPSDVSSVAGIETLPFGYFHSGSTFFS